MFSFKYGGVAWNENTEAEEWYDSGVVKAHKGQMLSAVSPWFDS